MSGQPQCECGVCEAREARSTKKRHADRDSCDRIDSDRGSRVGGYDELMTSGRSGLQCTCSKFTSAPLKPRIPILLSPPGWDRFSRAHVFDGALPDLDLWSHTLYQAIEGYCSMQVFTRALGRRSLALYSREAGVRSGVWNGAFDRLCRNGH